MPGKTNRREFLKTSALAGAGFWVAGGLQAAESKSPSEKLNIACIGVGGKGDSDWGYSWILVVGPIIGALVAVLVCSFCPSA